MRRRCACLDFIQANPADPLEVAAAVATHRAKPQHRDWWARQQVEDEKLHIPVAIGARASIRRVA
jgi:hypothetical protein